CRRPGGTWTATARCHGRSGCGAESTSACVRPSWFPGARTSTTSSRAGPWSCVAKRRRSAGGRGVWARKPDAAGPGPDGDLGLSDLPASDLHHRLEQLGRIRFKPGLVDAKKRDRGRKADTLVPVQEGMVLYEVEQVRGRHLVQRRMQVLTAERCLWHRQGGLEQPEIPDAQADPIPLDLIRMEREHLLQAQEPDFHSASLRKTPPYRS